MAFSDLHCHNHARAYLWLTPNERHERVKGRYSPWTVISPNQKRERSGKMAAGYSQCDLVRLWNGKVRLTFNALYPVEREFFRMPDNTPPGDQQFLKHIVRFLTSHGSPVREVLQMLYMRIPGRAVRHYKSHHYDYWEVLNHEMRFLLIDENKKVKNKIATPGAARRIFENTRRRRRNRPEALNAEGIYRVPRSSSALRESLNDDVITMIMTIEGAHALGTDKASFETYSKRVMTIKKEWPYPVFFITFAHHFNNYLCGHANSIPAPGDLLLNQTEGKNGPFTDEGRKIARMLLSVDAQNNYNPDLGYRILIDLKHMSALSRKQFYHEIVNPCFERGDIIPVIASHCGYSGIKSLDKHIENQELEDTDYTDSSGLYNAWNINMCDEDIRMIFKTKGLFGLSFDFRILGVPNDQKKGGPRNGIVGLWGNIRGVLEVIFQDDQYTLDEKKAAWEMITIGTDFEGFIDPINLYPTVLEFDVFRDDLINYIEFERRRSNPPQCVRHFTSRAQVARAVDNLCFGNAERFVLKHYMAK